VSSAGVAVACGSRLRAASLESGRELSFSFDYLFQISQNINLKTMQPATGYDWDTDLLYPKACCFGFWQLLATKNCCGLSNAQLFSQLL
jgi:hypothetical protein